MAYILALDQGTTSSRAILFDERGVEVARAQRELTQYFPASGEVEHDGTEIARDQIDCARAAIALAGIQPSAIAAIGITNQRETTLLWDRATGQPLGRAIVWQDRRTTVHCETLRAAGHSARVRELTGLVIDPYFSATKLAWLLDHTPGARARADRGELAFGTIDSWLVWQLTAGATHVTDVTNASRTLLYDIHRGEWSDDLLTLFNLPRSVLPRVVNSSGLIAHTAAAILGAAIPIAGIAGDQQAALFGQACHRAGLAKNTYGTGCFMLLHTGAHAIVSQSGLLTTRAATTGAAAYALEGSVFIGGAVVQWLRDGLGIIKDAGEIEALASQVPDADGVVFVPSFVGLGAPHWDPRARGAVFGLTRATTRAHLARAALNAIALQSTELALAMAADSRQPLTEMRVDGGASANNLLMQLQADLLGIPVVRPRVLETTALGAAYLAGLGVGIWRDCDELSTLWSRERVFEPQWRNDRRDAMMALWRKAVDRTTHWAD